MKKITISLILCTLVLCGLLAILVANENKLQEKTSKYYENLKIGETAVLAHGSEMTLNNVAFSSGEEINKPTKDKFLIVDLTIKNKYPREMNVSAILDFQLKDSNGISYNTVPEIIEGPQLSGSIPKKGELRAKIAYDVPESEYYEFSYRELYFHKTSSWEIESPKAE